jgi:hypothetical protein
MIDLIENDNFLHRIDNNIFALSTECTQAKRLKFNYPQKLSTNPQDLLLLLLKNYIRKRRNPHEVFL